MSMILSAFAAVFYGVADFSGGYAARKGQLLTVLVISQAAGAILAAVFILASGQPVPATADLAWGCVAGVAGALGLAMLYRGIARGLVALVSPTAALIGAAIPVVFGVLSGERPSATALAGTAICLPAIILLSWEQGTSIDRKAARSALLHGVLAGVPIGGFFIALANTSPGSGLWPVLAARVTSVPIVLVAAFVMRQKITVSRAIAAPALTAGLADMAANALVLLAIRNGLLSLAVIVSSLYPAPTVLMAWFFFRERIRPIRALGMAVAIAGVALIGLR